MIFETVAAAFMFWQRGKAQRLACPNWPLYICVGYVGTRAAEGTVLGEYNHVEVVHEPIEGSHFPILACLRQGTVLVAPTFTMYDTL